MKPGFSNQIGKLGEQMAVSYLQKEGHRILCRNYRTVGAEIDIISMKDQRLYMVEVKASRAVDSEADPLERVDARKVMRMKKAAGRYLSEHPIYYTEMRLAALVIEGIGRPVPIIQFVDDSE